MQNTYRKLNASAILRTARIAVMKAGNAEIVVNVPGREDFVIAMLGQREDGWGGAISDALVLSDVEGVICRMATTRASLARLEELTKECELQQAAENTAKGY
jgi:hypothetical protein